MLLEQLIGNLIQGLVLGAVYGMATMGLSLIFGVLKVVNVGHGAFIMVGAFITLWLFNALGISPMLAVPVAFIVGMGLGLLFYYTIMQRLIKAPELATLLATFAIGILLEETIKLIFGSEFRGYNWAVGKINLSITVLPMAIGIMLIGFFASTLPAAEIITETDIVEKVVQKKTKFLEMFRTFYENNDPVTARGLAQKQDTRFLIHHPPRQPLNKKELDRICELKYERDIPPSEETRVPLKGVFYEGSKGDIPVTQEGVSLSRKGILITAFKTNTDGDGMVLRLWEQAGNGGLCEVSLSKGNNYRRAYPCNLRGEITNDKGIDVLNNSFQFMIQANQPASFILK